MSQVTAQVTALKAYKRGFELAVQGDWAGARPFFLKGFQSDSQNLRYSLFLAAALFHTGDVDIGVKLWSLSADKDPMIRLAQFQPQADDLTKSVSRLADQEIRRHTTDIQTRAVSGIGEAGRMKSAIWPQTHFGPVPYQDGGPRPMMFFAPDLPEVPVFKRSDVVWTRELEAASAAIKNEFLSLFSGAHTGRPYVAKQSYLGSEWDRLKGRDDWTSIHLFQDGRSMPAAQACPQTCEILTSLPLVFHNGHPMEVFFSVLRPKTHIPPHYGLANCRVTVHLPLVIPPDCAIRVTDIQHEWTEGETFMFDDSFHHEAWNKSDEMRAVLIFEAWRPDMTSGEVKAAEASYAARQIWMESRKTAADKLLSSAAR